MQGLSQLLATLLDRCKYMSHLKQIRSLIITSGLSHDDPFCSRILSFVSLSELGDVDYSYRVPQKPHEPHDSVLERRHQGYCNGRNPNRCFSVFVNMLRLGLSPDHKTNLFLLKAAAKLRALKHGMACVCTLM